ncbi:hypothetical protein [uncultured Marinobacter sp.]|uniref:hypothetical protein n=1 Tax=uncultured Marinobacter sp. TaxID=187379 RepID=UPI0025E14675|nr:hypothetical protein [uncultured Marinobacter sp.]
MILALALVSLPAHSSDTAPAPLFCESAFCPLLSDVTNDGGQEGGLSHGNRLRDFSLHQNSTLSGASGFSGLVHCASFPILPQAPPAT